MLASRVRTSLESSGHEVEQDSVLPDELDGIDLVVADLDAVPPEQLAELGIPVIGFYQHTDVDTKAEPTRRASRSRSRGAGWSGSCRSWSSMPWASPVEQARRSAQARQRWIDAG